MKKRLLLVLMTVILTTGMFIPKTYANEGVTVKLPSFPVTINGTLINNKTSQYPMIVYNGITYFPMTYYDCRFLGLESIWDAKNGLTVEKTGVSWRYNKYSSNKPNNTSYTAKIAGFKIKVNGKKIDNSKQEYPLLFFRNITYFPLTWQFAVEEFGWKYSFDSINGLIITSTENESSAGQLTLPIATRENGEKGAFTMAGDYFYYEGPNGIIYQSPVARPHERKKIYQLPETGYGAKYVYASLKTENGRILLNYHTGGATTGSDHLILLNEDGSFRELDAGYSVMKIYDDYQIRVNQSFPPVNNNLQMRKSGEPSYKSVGNPEYLYGWIWTADKNSGSMSGIQSKDLYLINDDIFVLGTPDKDNTYLSTGIYKININTGITEKVCEESVSGFKIFENTIYFTDLNNSLYRVLTVGGSAEKLISKPVANYSVLKGMIYYSLDDGSNQLYIYGRNDSVNPGGKLKSLEIQSGYMVAVFDKKSESPHKMMIIDERGKVIYKTMENVLLVRIENGKVVFVKDN
ncbi:MAG TPA: hypothetical protein DC038_07155 [Clostridiales bacterium]|nr:hypothetical protein [Clostridiales bacterium]